MIQHKPEAEPKAVADKVPVYCAHDKIVDVATLVPNPKNPNTHPDGQIQLLGQIIRQTGWRQPITVSTRSGFIVKGHGRLAAAQLEGFKEVPVDFQNYASEAEEYADLVADNRIAELSEIDQKMLADIFADIDTGEIPIEQTGYTEKEVENLVTALSEALHEEPEEEEPEETPERAFTHRGDIWILGRDCRIMCGNYIDDNDLERLFPKGFGKYRLVDIPFLTYAAVKEEEFKGSLIMEPDPEFVDVLVKRYVHLHEERNIRLVREGIEVGREFFEEIFSE